jgi:hypothetical protein
MIIILGLSSHALIKMSLVPSNNFDILCHKVNVDIKNDAEQ